MNPDIALLENVRSKIEQMSKERHIQALNILAKYPSITINEQKYGQLNVNLSCIPKEAIDDLCKFISYVEAQELSLIEIEEQKKKYQDTYFASEVTCDEAAFS
jgi:repressor of nif and glnA expression